MKTLRYKIGISILIAFCTMLLMALISKGIFLDDYEVLINALIRDISYHKSPSPFLLDVNFLVLGVYVFIQKICGNYSSYGLIRSFFNLISISILVYLFIRRKPKLVHTIILFAILMLCYDPVVLLNSISTSMFLFFAAFLLAVFSPTSNNSFYVFIILTFIALSCRIESVLILSTLALLASLFSSNRRLRKLALSSFSISVFTLMTFYCMFQLDVDGLKDFYTYERSYQDRMDMDISKSMSDPTQDKTELLKYAKGMFLLDDPNLKSISPNYGLKSPSVIDYLFFNAEFFTIFFAKAKEFVQNFIQHNSPLFLLDLLALLLLIGFKSIFPFSLWKKILFVFIYLSIPFAINGIASVNPIFLKAYAVLPLLLIALYIIERKIELTTITSIMLPAMLLLLSFYQNVNFYSSVLSERHECESISREIFLDFEDEVVENSLPIVLVLEYDLFLPSNIFSTFYSSKYLYLDVGPLSSFNHFQSLFSEHYGADYRVLTNRVNVALNENSALYASEERIAFIQLYLQKVCNFDIQYVKVKSFSNSSLEKFEINRKQ